jgi:hypothetical protein
MVFKAGIGPTLIQPEQSVHQASQGDLSFGD